MLFYFLLFAFISATYAESACCIRKPAPHAARSQTRAD
jgi:hypothetical protein